jgi:Fe2+ transport system protein FeoA
MRSPGGDPTAYRVRGTLVALRRDQARHVLVERQTEEAPRG